MARTITDTELFKELLNIELKNDITCPLSSIIKHNLQSITELMLAEIVAYMPEYTLHNINHVVNILDIIHKILPPKVILNRSELTLIIYAAALHDIGMLVNKEDADLLKQSELYKRVSAEYDKNINEEELLSEVIRRSHVNRSCDYIDEFKRNYNTYKLDFEIDGIDFSKCLKKIILSHGLSVDDLIDAEYPTNLLLGQDRVNLKFLALLLRLGDILDFDNSRTPKFLLEHKKVSNFVSQLEWEKHLSINGVCISDTLIEFQAVCTSAEVHKCVIDFLNYIEVERRETMECIGKMHSEERYLTLDKPVVILVESDGSYIYDDLNITFDYKKVLSILMGTELYRSHSVFIREILQNSYDACYTRREIEERKGDGIYLPKIHISFDSKNQIFVIEDNGIGMDMLSVRNYVTRIGNSYYQSKEFQNQLFEYKPISKFGIGILSCFMVSNSIQIDSLKCPLEPFEINEAININLNVERSFVERKPTERNKIGTKITLHLQDEFCKELTLDKIKNIVEDYMSYQEIPITIQFDQEECVIEKDEISLPTIYGETGVEVIKIEDELLEGYLILYGYEHQGLVNDYKICQQNFRINSIYGVDLGIKPSFIEYLGYNINIKANYLSPKASRDGVIHNYNLVLLRERISDIVLDYFSKNETALIKYLIKPQECIFTKRENEFEFIARNIKFQYLNFNGEKQFERAPLFYELRAAKKKCKLIFISHSLLYKDVEFFAEELVDKGEYMVICGMDMHYFFQLAFPYCISLKEVISDVPGLMYILGEYDFSKNIVLSDYPKSYSFLTVNDNLKVDYKKETFFHVSNNLNNHLILHFNPLNRWGRLFLENKSEIGVKKVQTILKEKIESLICAKDSTPIKSIGPYVGEYYHPFSCTCDYSYKMCGMFDIEVIDSINASIFQNISSDTIKKYGLQESPLTIDDFIDWWFVKR